ncbi:low-affinity phosphate transporter [Coniosporium tulheliwenetii]|uniref:Low-affinity phosphate transporter n=1 Tax=Coniosporium tulheliwenetii TaxID=3383036 RepID=A0ACC2YN59_9PEZI|nr:low-affinity phosphate transporter [Cladosporium sp. JES 115]
MTYRYRIVARLSNCNATLNLMTSKSYPRVLPVMTLLLRPAEPEKQVGPRPDWQDAEPEDWKTPKLLVPLVDGGPVKSDYEVEPEMRNLNLLGYDLLDELTEEEKGELRIEEEAHIEKHA